MRASPASRHVVPALLASLLLSTLGAAGGAAPAQAAFGGTAVLAYARWPIAERSALWTASPSLSGRRLRYTSAAYNIGAPTVSQDGTKIAYEAWTESATFMNRIYVIDRAGTAGPVRWTLPASPYSDSAPVFAPDRSALFFVRFNRTTGTSRIFRLTTAGGTPTAVPNTVGATKPTVSPDGRYLAFSRSGAIWVVKATGADPFVLRTGSASSGYFAPRWSPDGTRLSTIRTVRGTSTAVYLVGTSRGAGNGTVTSYPASSELTPAGWSNDGRALYYSSLVGTGDQYAANLLRVPAQLGATRVALTANGPQDGYDHQPALGGGAAPPADSLAPAVGVTVTTVAATSVTLSFTGTSSDVSRYVLRYADGSVAPTTAAAGALAYTGLRRTGITVSGLTPGRTYSFTAHAVDWAGNVSPLAKRAVTIPAMTRLSVAAADTTVRYGTRSVLTATLTNAGTAGPLADRPVQLFARRRTTTTTTSWVLVAGATTGPTGVATGSHLPTVHTEYQWRFAGSTRYAPAASPGALISVASVVTAALDKTTMPLGATAELRGAVRPAQAGEKVLLQRQIDGVWTTLTSASLSSTSGYFFPLKPPAKGPRVYRVVKAKDAGNLLGISPVVTLQVT
ncbi:MAG TPA: fibronectin type III domain-containing protein [Mycobacteriales bacterium]|nr:fibronectin type III domain-containing protein [Mycobacteriales bacterium]